MLVHFVEFAAATRNGGSSLSLGFYTAMLAGQSPSRGTA